MMIAHDRVDGDKWDFIENKTECVQTLRDLADDWMDFLTVQALRFV